MNQDFPFEDESIDFRKYFFLFISNWYWIVIGILFTGALGWFYLRYTTPMYEVKSTMLINENEQKSFSEEMIIADLGFERQSNIINELQVLKSSKLMKKVVDSLQLNITYRKEGRVSSTELYRKANIQLEIIGAEEMTYGNELKIQLIDQQKFALIKNEGDTSIINFSTPFQLNNGNFLLHRIGEIKNTGSLFFIKVKHPNSTARSLTKKLTTEQIQYSNAIALKFKDNQPERAIDILLALVDIYNRNVIEEKSTSGQQTMSFISERLQFITEELYDVEQEVQEFREQEGLAVDITEKASNFLSQLNETDQLIMEIDLQFSTIKQLESFLSQDTNYYRVLPIASVVIQNSMSTLVESYNTLIFQREQQLEAATSANPVIATYDEQLDYLRNNIFQNIRILKGELMERKVQLENRLKPIERQVYDIPGNQKQLLQIMRQQQIKEQLFLFLLQKQEETALSIAAQTANARILEMPIKGKPVSPNKNMVYILSIIMGGAIPIGIILISDLLDNKVYNKKDIQNATNTPFLGAISVAKKDGPLVISKGSRSSIAEMFRLLRTNLGYLNQEKKENQVFLITSSISGEGKTFITINLGLSFALAGKRTILLGLDLRKPRLSKYIIGGKLTKGISNYLIGDVSVESIIHSVKGYENIDFIGSGPLPPNPSELIMNKRLDQLIAHLKENYDCIIIDTAPVGLVTDGFLLGHLVDHSIIVTRHGYSEKGMIGLIDEIYRAQKLPGLGVILNGVKRGKGYGYGGYGYGYGYYEDDKANK